MPVTSTFLDQVHNTIERQLFAMKGFHRPDGSQQAFLVRLAHLDTLVPYQRRARMQVSGGGKSKVGEYPQQTGCSTCKSSPRAAFDEQNKRSTTSCGGMCFS